MHSASMGGGRPRMPKLKVPGGGGTGGAASARSWKASPAQRGGGYGPEVDELTPSGAMTERAQRPLRLDMTGGGGERESGMQSMKGGGSSSMAGKPMLGDLSMSDISRQGPSTLGRPGELDNWPSTQAQGSHSWLKRLERFLDTQLDRVGENDLEGRLKVHHECLAQFSEVWSSGFRVYGLGFNLIRVLGLVFWVDFVFGRGGGGSGFRGQGALP